MEIRLKEGRRQGRDKLFHEIVFHEYYEKPILKTEHEVETLQVIV